MSKLKTLGRFGAVLLLLAAAGAWAQAPADELTVTFRKPNVDIKQYSKLLILPLNLSDTRVVPPPWVENAKPHEWDLTKKNQAALQSAYASAVREGIETSGDFKVVDAAAPGVLQIEVRLISLTPWAARGEQASTLGTGTLAFETHVRDASTGELLAVFSGNQAVGKDYQENTDFNRAAGVTEHFKNWGRNVSKRLTAARAQ